jgi:hypothetical protein
VFSNSHNETVPFTLSHAAAALPFRRTRLIPSALVMGAFAPDFEYFLRFAPVGPFGHTLRGAFLFSLPAALAALWLFHRFVKLPLTLLLPEPLQRRLAPYLGPFRFSGTSRFGLITLSILVGIATHLAWDSFTHPFSWLYFHWPLLSQRVAIPGIGAIRYCRVFQHLSTLIGFGILLVWSMRWYRTVKPSTQPLDRRLTPTGRTVLLAIVPAIALLGTIVWVAVASRPHGFLSNFERILGAIVITPISLAWWQLVFFGALIAHPALSVPRARTRAG